LGLARRARPRYGISAAPSLIKYWGLRVAKTNLENQSRNKYTYFCLDDYGNIALLSSAHLPHLPSIGLDVEIRFF
jgi:hypothetical protein